MSKKSYVYLNPASADGKSEVVELEYESEPVKYLEPLAENDDLGKLRDNVHEARAKLHHAKSRGVGVADAQKALEDANRAAGSAHYAQKQDRQRQQTGGDSPFSRQSEDKRQFMEPVPYFTRNDSDTDSSGATFDDDADDELEAKVLALVHALEQAMSDGAPQAKIEKLAAAIKVLREQFYYPGNQPQDAPSRKRHIDQNPGGEADTTAITAPFPGEKKLPDDGPAWTRQSAADPAPKKKPTKAETKAGWDLHLKQLDERLKNKALASVYPAPAAASPAKATHARNTCCEGDYKCARCKAAA